MNLLTESLYKDLEVSEIERSVVKDWKPRESSKSLVLLKARHEPTSFLIL